jgi:23S rRNA U2552 (ribose-2'-O)-methylase RlmE/FtsJ
MKQFIVYKDILTAQLPSTVDFLQKVIDENDFQSIIEIGTNRGGLTLWLNDHKKDSTKIYTFEIFPDAPLINSDQIDGELIIDDVFSKNSLEKIKGILLKSKQCLILCDGGHKNQEFNLFSQFLKSGDIIMLHDYQDNIDEYMRIQSTTGWGNRI